MRLDRCCYFIIGALVGAFIAVGFAPMPRIFVRAHGILQNVDLKCVGISIPANDVRIDSISITNSCFYGSLRAWMTGASGILVSPTDRAIDEEPVGGDDRPRRDTPIEAHASPT